MAKSDDGNEVEKAVKGDIRPCSGTAEMADYLCPTGFVSALRRTQGVCVFITSSDAYHWVSWRCIHIPLRLP